MYKTLILFVLLFPLAAWPQSNSNSFSTIDSFARSVRYHHDIYRLTKDLTDRYTEPLQKTRSIFIWITDNIRYDYQFINQEKEVKIPECYSATNCEHMLQEWEEHYLNRVLRRKKAVCDGYSRLFKKMCTIAGIQCEIVVGYVRTKPYQVGNAGTLDHAWNVVWVDSAYHFLDATWAAGGCPENEETGKLRPFVKRYNEYYWFTPFHELSRNHYPKEYKWVMEPAYTKERFADNPYYLSRIIPDIRLLSPDSGIIHADKGDTVHFKFEYKGSIRRLQVNSSFYRNPSIWEEVKKHGRTSKRIDTLAMKKQLYVAFQKDGDVYTFDYVVPDNSLYYLDILFDYERVMKFNVKIDHPTL